MAGRGTVAEAINPPEQHHAASLAMRNPSLQGKQGSARQGGEAFQGLWLEGWSLHVGWCPSTDAPMFGCMPWCQVHKPHCGEGHLVYLDFLRLRYEDVPG